jgi:hypothetical protein
MQKIDQIRLCTEQTASGKEYDVARLWIASVPFSAYLTPQVERIVRRMAAEWDIDLIDVRKSTVGF